MPSNKYDRDFYDYGALKRPGRIDRDLFQGIEDVGDGYGGIQWIHRHILGDLLIPKFVIDGCLFDGVDTLSNGYIMFDGEVVQVEQQTIVVANGNFLFIDIQGNAHTTGVQATAQAQVLIYERNAGGTGYDIRFRVIDNILSALGFQAQWLTIEHDVDINGSMDVAGSIVVHTNIDVDGVSNLDNTDIDGTLDVSGVTDIHDVLDMNANRVEKVADPTAAQDAVTRTYLRNFMPVGTILMYNGVGWVDNVSMVGWYKCDGGNGTPNLVNKFIRSEAASGNTGGADTVSLASNQIPTHTTGGISANHIHTVTINNSTTNHTHSGTTSGTAHVHTVGLQSASHYHAVPNFGKSGSSGPRSEGTDTLNEVGDDNTDPQSVSHNHNVTGGSHTHTITTGNQSVQHAHNNSVGNQSADHTHTYTNASLQAHQNMPAYYSLIFVMRTV